MNSTELELTVAFVFKLAPAEPEAVAEFEGVSSVLALISLTNDEP